MEGHEHMTVELFVTTKGESTCVALLGEFDVEGVEELRSRLEHHEQNESQPVLDLKRILVAEPPKYVERSMALGTRPAGDADADA
jgi:hypothetical protein